MKLLFKPIKVVVLVVCMMVILLTPSCLKLRKLVQFNLDYSTSVVIPASTGIALPIDLLTPDVTTNSEARFREEDTRKDLINSIRLTELKMVISSPENSDFSFLKSAFVTISSDGLDDLQIASINVPDNAGNVLFLEFSGDDLAPYIKAEEFTLKLKATTDELLAQDHQIEILSQFIVEGKLAKQD